MKCPSCKTENSTTARFCTQCGVELPIHCPSCGEINPVNGRYCGGCGKSLARGARSLGANGDIATSSGPDNGTTGSERRHLTVLFCDMVGSTALAKVLDPEDLSDITRTYYERCSSAIEQFDGIIANYIGDGIMALFGYPRAHEDDAESAIYAAFSIIRAVETIGQESERSLRVRIGIATGLVVVGEDGSHALTKEKTVVGEAPNLAAHLQASAQPGCVIISEATRRLVGDVFKLERMQIDNLKGATGPAVAWRVLEAKAVASRFAAHAGTLTKFVGRDQEVALLTDRWQQVKQSEGQVLLLGGEAGLGKSRIVEAFRELIADEPQFAMHYQCSAHHMDSALYPIIARFELAAGLNMGNDLPAVRLEKVEAVLQQNGANLGDVIPLVATLISIPSGDRYLAEDVDPQRRKERTLSMLIDRLADLASKRPVLIIVEDLHWADPTTLELLSRAMPRIPDMRVLLVMTYRPEFRAPWTGHAHVTALLLNRLGRRHCRAMIELVANSKPLPPDVMEQVIAKTDGVPLFVEELTKTVLESGFLHEQQDGWLLRGPLQEFAIPATLQVRCWPAWIDCNRSRKWRSSGPRSGANSPTISWPRCRPCPRATCGLH